MSATIEVANVGPIRHAQLSLGELNVLIGPNGLGKTFFATIIDRLLVSQSAAYPPTRIPGQTIPGGIVDFVEKFYIPLLSDEGLPTDEELRIDDDVRAWANGITGSILRRYGEVSRRGIARGYGVHIERLRRQPDSYSRHESYVSVENHNPRWAIKIPMDVDLDFTLTYPDPDHWIRAVFSPDSIRQFIGSQDPRLLIEHDDGIASRKDIERLCESLLYYRGDTTLFNSWPSECLHLTSERSVTMQSYRTIDGTEVRKNSFLELEPFRRTSIDVLSSFVSPETKGRSRRKAGDTFTDLVSRIEDKLRAAISVVESPSGMDQIVVTTPEGEFQLSQASSMLNELSALLLALKYRLDVHDYLTIDQPEAQLHPEMQIEVAKLLVNLASAGLTITLTTHSDYVLEQINNAIRRSQLVKGASTEDVLQVPRISYDHVRALLFDRSDDGCLAEDAMGDIIDPIRQDTFTAASRRQYDESVLLINRLLERSNTARWRESHLSDKFNAS